MAHLQKHFLALYGASHWCSERSSACYDANETPEHRATKQEEEWMNLGAEGEQERGKGDQGIGPMREGVTTEVESRHAEEPSNRGICHAGNVWGRRLVCP